MNLFLLARVEPECEDTECGLSLVTTVHECLHSANFWEQENLRCESIALVIFYIAIHNLTSIVLCYSTRANDLFGLRRRRKNTGRCQETPICEG